MFIWFACNRLLFKRTRISGWISATYAFTQAHRRLLNSLGEMHPIYLTRVAEAKQQLNWKVFRMELIFIFFSNTWMYQILAIASYKFDKILWLRSHRQRSKMETVFSIEIYRISNQNNFKNTTTNRSMVGLDFKAHSEMVLFAMKFDSQKKTESICMAYSNLEFPNRYLCIIFAFKLFCYFYSFCYFAQCVFGPFKRFGMHGNPYTHSFSLIPMHGMA